MENKQRKWTKEKLISKTIELNPVMSKYEFVSDFEAINKHIILKDKYGLLRVLPSNLIKGKTPTIQSAINKTKYWVNMILERFGDRYDYSSVQYINNSNKVIIICKKHGEFLQSPQKHLSGEGCPTCAYENASRNLSCSHEEFIDKLKFKNPQILEEVCFIDEYTNRDTYMLAQSKYGVVKLKPGKLLSGRMFTIESAINKNDYVKNEFIAIHGNLYDYSSVEYISHKTKVIIKCKEHGEFLCTPSNHKKGRGCPKCSSSKGESCVLYVLEKLHIEYDTEYSLDGCFCEKPLRFDFYIESLNVAIEYDGVGHFEPVDFGGMGDEYAATEFQLVQKRDKIKNQYCKDNKIKLIRIPYWDIENIEDILMKELVLKE